MAAGAVAVPSIIPLRVPIPGKNKSEIDTNTLIELRTGKQTMNQICKANENLNNS